MEQLMPQWPTLIAQLVNVIILFGLLFLVAYKPVMKMMDERSNKIKESLEQAEILKEQTAHAEDEVKKQLDDAKKQGQAIISQAMKTGEELRQKAQQEARQDTEILIARAHSEIQHERDEAIGEIRREFADLTIMAAEKVIDTSLDRKAHNQLIEKVLEEGLAKKKE